MTTGTGEDAKAWFACDEPERPVDIDCLWHLEGCQACAIKAVARAHTEPLRRNVVLARLLTEDAENGGRNEGQDAEGLTSPAAIEGPSFGADIGGTR